MEQQAVTAVTQLNADTSDLVGLVERFDDLVNGVTPIVIVPDRRIARPFHFIIPEDCFCIVQKDGKDLGVWESGFHFAPWRYRVAYMVTKRATTYDFRVVSCPTADNVICKVDVTFVFKITNPCDFCYRLGAMNFDNHLRSVAEETLRSMIRCVNHINIYELRVSGSNNFMNVLNVSFQHFGVEFSSVTIKNIEVPSVIFYALETASKYTSSLNHHIKEHEFKEKILTDRLNFEVEQHRLAQERKLKQLVYRKEKISLQTDKKVEKIEKKNHCDIILEESIAESEVIRSQASFRDAQVKARADSEKMIENAKANLERAKKEVDEWRNEQLIKSKSELLTAESNFKIIQELTNARENTALLQTRKQEISVERLKTLATLATSANMAIFASTGQKLIDNFVF